MVSPYSRLPARIAPTAFPRQPLQPRLLLGQNANSAGKKYGVLGYPWRSSAARFEAINSHKKGQLLAL